MPVADVERAKTFYAEKAGFDLNVDTVVGQDLRIVQLNPHGSACSICTMKNESAAGSVQGLHLMVTDIVAARHELVSRGVDVQEIKHMNTATGEWVSGPHPDRSDYNSFAEFADPDGNGWLLQEVGWGDLSRKNRV
ncbi:MAG TPA: VOC family protein [Chloroflexota bacterium]|nr:VOC family protein [Chloroflexota bacterium]